MYSYLVDHFRMSNSKVRERLGCIAEVEIELTTLGAFLWTVRHGLVSRLAPDEMTRVCGDDGALV